MNGLTWVPVSSGSRPRMAGQRDPYPGHLSRCEFNKSPSFALKLRGTNDGEFGELVVEPVTLNQLTPAVLSTDVSTLAFLHGRPDRPTPPWTLVARSRHIGVNGQTPPLPVTTIEPGDLLTVGDRTWMVATLWQPEPVEAPRELCNKPCPVCGVELGVAPVVQCTCGRWLHLENPTHVDDPQALNCFLKAGVCGECGRRGTLEPQLMPELPISLAAADSEVMV